MNYARIYAAFIDDRKAKQPQAPDYFEKHHIKPRCLGGGDEPENIIRLTPEDHFFAHLLLAKAHGGHLWYALQAMLMTGGGRISDSYLKRARKHVASTRKNAAVIHSLTMKGRFVGEAHPMWGKSCSELAKQKTRELHASGFNPMASYEARMKVSEALRGRKFSEEHRNKIAEAKTGTKRSEASRQKQSATMTGIKRSPEFCASVSAGLAGKKKSAEHVEKMRIANLGKTVSQATRKKISDRWAEDGHPKGMLGKQHSDETRLRYVALNAGKRAYAVRFGVSPRVVTIKMMEAAGIHV